MAVAGQLFRLEQLDSEIDQHEAALADLRRRHTRNADVEEAEAAVVRLRAERDMRAAEQRRLESDLADLEARIKRDNDRMYGGKIVDARELASLERELGHHREQRDGVEERLLQLMEEIETLDSRLAAEERAASHLRKEWEDGRPEIARQHTRIRTELRELREQRDALAATLDPRSLSVYTRLRTGSGHAVSSVTNGVCQWCRVVIPPKDVQHARSALVTCSNCARVLYIGS